MDAPVFIAEVAMRKFIYADESGNFDFSGNPKASKFFILTTVIVDDHAVASELFELRRQLAWEGYQLPTGFHATEDAQYVRNAVFSALQQYTFRIDATVLEKRKSRPQIRSTDMRFYQHAWFYHMKYIVPRVFTEQDELLLVAATLGRKRRGVGFNKAVEDVMNQVSGSNTSKIAHWQASSDPCLQIADYCSWAIQRKWESDDDRSYQLISGRIGSEYDLFKSGNTYYY